MREKDLAGLLTEGCKKLSNNPESDLTPRDAQTLIRDFHLKGSNEVAGLIGAVYSIGYEQGYRDGQSKTNKEEEA
jgi:hypothetical protein